MENKVISNITIEDAKIIFKNFQGKEGPYNRAGERNFGVLIDDDDAKVLANDGWNIKFLSPREEDPDQHPQAWLPVKVKFGKIPPTAVLITSRGKVKLTEETIGQLDWSYFKTVDLVIRPYNYPAFGGRETGGISAYLKAIYVTIQEDDLSLKYGDVPEMDDVKGNEYMSRRG